jgi:YD repeat-containing protein
MQQYRLPNHISFTWVLTALLVFVLWNVPTQAQSSLPVVTGVRSGELAGSFAVSESGAAEYSLPISVLPGSNGMQPKLALTYSSRAGNSVLGLGWSLSGLSVVTRCATTKAQDGFIDGVDFDEHDKFCLDGQRLMMDPASGTTYGQHNSEYRTESDVFTKVKASVGAGAPPVNPNYFTAWTKSGLMFEYGATPESAFVPAGSNDRALLWAVNRIGDTVGNYLEIRYDEIQAEGVQRVSRINYTGNLHNGVQPYNSVRFVYESRPDLIARYVGGAKVVVDTRLKEIKLFYQETEISRYLLGYEQAPDTGFSRLTTVTVCDSTTGECAHPTIFTYAGAYQGLETPSVWLEAGVSNGPAFDANGSGHGFADFDGNGRADWYWTKNGIQIGLSTATDFEEHVALPSSDWQAPYKKLEYFSDHDGDGKTDRGILINTGGYTSKYTVSSSNGSSLNTSQSWISSAQYPQPILYGMTFPFLACFAEGAYAANSERLLDVNGDGRADRIWLGANQIDQCAGPTGSSGWWVALGTANGFSAPQFWISWSCTEGAVNCTNYQAGIAGILNAFSQGLQLLTFGEFADVNGDTLPDLTFIDHNTSARFVGINLGNTFTVPVQWLQAGYTEETDSFAESTLSQRRFLDMNGDGNSDYIWVPLGKKQIRVALSTGTSFAAPTTWMGDDQLGGFDPTSKDLAHFDITDMNGDNFPDLVIVPENSNDVWIAFSDGTQFRSPRILAPNNFISGKKSYSLGGSREYLVDVNGDNLTDYAWFPENTSDLYVARALGMPANLLIKVTTGHGLEHRITWSTLSTPDGTYAKGNGAVYPEMDLQTPYSIVKSYEYDDGIGGAVKRSYHYAGLRYSHDGRGLLGYQTITEIDEDLGFSTVTTYRQDFPFKGNVLRVEKIHIATGAHVYRLENSWQVQSKPWGSHFTFLADSQLKEWDLQGLLLKDESSEYSYDAFGNATTVKTTSGIGTGRTITSTFDNDVNSWQLGRLRRSDTLFTAPGTANITAIAEFEYDAITGLLKTELVEPYDAILSVRKEYQRDVFGNVIRSRIFGPSFATIEEFSEYDPTGRFLTKKTNALGHVVLVAYDLARGNKTATTDSNGNTTEWEYDFLGRMIHERTADGLETATHYLVDDGNGPMNANTMVRVDRSGAPPQFAYFDLHGRELRKVTTAFDGTPVSLDREYNHKGELLRESVPWENSIMPSWPWAKAYTYDDLGRVLSITRPMNKVTTYTYTGLTVTLKNARNQILKQTRNLQNELIETEDHNGSKTLFARDARRRLTSITDSAGNVTAMTYDLLGNRISLNEPNSGITTFTFNALGNLVFQRDADGNEISYAYDSAGRLITRTEASDVNSWQYDTAVNGIGMPAMVTGPNGYKERYTYDTFSRPQTTIVSIDGADYTIGTSYDNFGRVATLTYPSGFTIRNQYNQASYLNQIIDDASGALIWKARSQSSWGYLTEEEFGNGVVAVRNYDQAFGYLTGLVASVPGNTPLQDLQYTLDDLGNVLSRKDHIQNLTEEFTYDTLNRLIRSEVIEKGTSVDIQYDALGNIIFKSDVGSYSYQNGRPHAVSSIAGVTPDQFTYDARGNRTASNATNVSYTAFNQPREIVTSTARLRFFYSPGRALYKQILSKQGGISPITQPGGVSGGMTVPQQSEVKRYIGQFTEISTKGVRTRNDNFIYADGRRVAVFSENNDGSVTARYILSDRLGSPDVITDSVGSVLERLSFDPWGKRRESDWDKANAPIESFLDVGFTGHEQLDAVGLVHMGGARIRSTYRSISHGRSDCAGTRI